MPSGVERIEKYVFNGCVGLANVTVPVGVKAVGVHAFNGCIRLEHVTLPETINIIEKYSFNGCIGLKRITFGGAAEQWLAVDKSGVSGNVSVDFGNKQNYDST